VVKEPPQSQKIKLRVPSQPQATPPATGPPKKITIVHGAGSTTATASPAPPNAGVEGAVNGIPPQPTVMPGPNGVAPSGLSMTPGHPAQRSSMSTPMPSASPGLGRFRLEPANGQTPGYMPRPNGIPPQPMPVANGLPPPVHQAQAQYHQQVTPMQIYQPPPPPPEPRPQPIYQNVFRAPGKGNVANSSHHTPMLTV
jgi:hypothetical protein